MKLFRMLALWVVFAVGSFPSQAQDTLAFQLNAHNNLLFPVVLNNSDSLLLMLHTAVFDVSIMDTCAESLEWMVADSVESWGGSSEARFSAKNTLQLDALQFDDVGVWECRRSGPDSDGKFGLSIFEGAPVQINYEASELIVLEELPKDLSTYAKCPVVQNNDMVFVTLQFDVDGDVLHQDFLVHTGYGGTLLLDDAFVKEHQLSERLEITDQKFLKDSFGNEIAVNKAKISEVRWMDFEMEEVPVGFFEGTIARQHMSVLGADFLKRFDVIFDAQREFIYLKSNRNFDEEFSTI